MSVTIGELPLAERRRDPHLGVFPQKLKARREDADDGIFLVIQPDGFTYDPPAAKLPQPQRVTDQRNFQGRGVILFGKEQAARGSPDSQHRE